MTELRKITQEELNEKLKLHKLWMESEGKEGKFANFIYKNLQGLDLSGAYLGGAYLTFLNLKEANLTNASILHLTKQEFLDSTITDEYTILTDVKFKGE